MLNEAKFREILFPSLTWTGTIKLADLGEEKLRIKVIKNYGLYSDLTI